MSAPRSLALGVVLLGALAAGAEQLYGTVHSDGETAQVQPTQLITNYGINQLPADGSGQTVAIIMTDFVDEAQLQSDLDQETKAYNDAAPAAGLAKIPRVKIKWLHPAGDPPDPAPTDWQTEASIDTQMIHLVAPKANIIAVAVDGGPKTMTKAITAAVNSGASIVSMSFGQAYESWKPDVVAQWEAAFSAHPNISFIAGSGDKGVNPGTGNRFQVAYPASSPSVVAVGAVNEDFSETPKVWTATKNPKSGATGGGQSTAFDRPAYQTMLKFEGTKRLIPDISFLGGAQNPIGIYVNNTVHYANGTSVSAPIFAGVIALANQMSGAPLGDLHEALYRPLYRGHLLEIYRDAKSGNNTYPGTNTKAGYDAKAGFDLCSGLGVPRVVPFVNYLAKRLGTCLIDGTASTITSGACRRQCVAGGGTSCQFEGVSFK